MATTAQGTTYVESSDLVSAYPTASLAVANAIDAKASLAMTQNAQTGTSYTAALTDGYKLVTMSNAAANTFTVPPQSSVTWVAGQQLRLLNLGAGSCTITPGAGVTINGTPLALAQHKGGTLIRTASDVWTFIPFQGGASAPVVNEGSSTNATFATLTNPDSDGVNYRKATWTASGQFVTTTAGRVQVLIVGAGGPYISGAHHGDSGRVVEGWYDLPAGTHVVTVGAATTGGGSYARSGFSAVGSIKAMGGQYGVGGPTEGAGDGTYGEITSTISGSSQKYAGGGTATLNATTTYGSGGYLSGNNPQNGVVIVRYYA